MSQIEKPTIDYIKGNFNSSKIADPNNTIAYITMARDNLASIRTAQLDKQAKLLSMQNEHNSTPIVTAADIIAAREEDER